MAAVDDQMLMLLALRERCEPADLGKVAVVVDGAVVFVGMDYEAALTHAYAHFGLGHFLVTILAPLAPHEVLWRDGYLAAEAEYASWLEALGRAVPAA